MQGGGEGGFEGGRGGFIREQVAPEGLPGNLGGDLKRARNLRQGHLFDFAVTEVLEEAEDGGEEFLAGGPFVFPKFAGATVPIGGVLPGEGGRGGDLRLKQAGLEGVQAVGPAILAGPIFDGGGIFAKDIGTAESERAWPSWKKARKAPKARGVSPGWRGNSGRGPGAEG